MKGGGDDMNIPTLLALSATIFCMTVPASAQDHALFGRKATTDPAGSLSRMATSIAFASAA